MVRSETWSTVATSRSERSRGVVCSTSVKIAVIDCERSRASSAFGRHTVGVVSITLREEIVQAPNPGP